MSGIKQGGPLEPRLSAEGFNPPVPQSTNLPIVRDFVPLAFSTVGFSILLGTAIMSGFLLINRALVQDLPQSATPDVNQPAAVALFAGSLCTLIVPALVAWALLSPVDSAYRRGGLSMVAGFGAILVSLASIPLNEFFGMGGLVGLLATSLAGCTLLGRKVMRERAAV